MRGRSGGCGTNATNRAKRWLAGIELFDTGDSPCTFAPTREFAGGPANCGQINEKVRRLSGNLGATLEFRTVPIFATEGGSNLAKRLRANLGLVVMVGHSGGRWGVSVC